MVSYVQSLLANFVSAYYRITTQPPQKKNSFFLFPAPLDQICFVVNLISPNRKARNRHPEMVMARTVDDCDFSRVYYVPNITPDQLPVGLLAQLVKQCTGIAEFMCSNPKIKSEDRFHIHIIFMSSTTVETIFINLILTIFIKSKECAPQREQQKQMICKGKYVQTVI